MKTIRDGIGGFLVGVVLTLLSVGATAQTVTTPFGPFSITNTSGGQLSSPYFELSVSTASQLDVEYVAASTHCSNVIMHFLVDGVERAVSGSLSPGQSTGFVTLGPVAPGTYVVGLQAEGVVGGCNTGALQGWGGSGNTRTIALAATSEPAQVPGPGLLITALVFLGGAWMTLRRRLRSS